MKSQVQRKVIYYWPYLERLIYPPSWTTLSYFFQEFPCLVQFFPIPITSSLAIIIQYRHFGKFVIKKSFEG